MRVLAVDTTSPRGSVAVAGPEGVLAEARLVTAEGHSRWLLPAVEALLRGLGLDASALDVFAVTTGPGSFTGLRVGLGSVQGLALASGRPCVGLPTLDVLAGVGGRVLGDGRGPRRRLPGRGLLGGLRRRRRASAARTGSGRWPRCSWGCPRGRRSSGRAALEHREAIRAAVPGAVFPASAEFLAAPLAAAALRLAASGATVSASGAAAALPAGRRRPPVPGVSPGSFLRRALLADVPALAALEAACFTHPWTPAQIHEEVARVPPDMVLVLEGPGPRAGRRPGYAPTAPSASSWTRCT